MTIWEASDHVLLKCTNPRHGFKMQDSNGYFSNTRGITADLTVSKR